jgi:hypothetical protein
MGHITWHARKQLASSRNNRRAIECLEQEVKGLVIHTPSVSVLRRLSYGSKKPGSQCPFDHYSAQ